MHSQFKLKNGFTVINAPQKESKSLTLLVLYRVGSRYEEDKIYHGVSHFIEHLMFKGTKKRPNTLAISKELDGVGAEFNAFTSKDYTGYYIKVNAEKLELACDLLSDMLNNSLFDPQEMAREKGVIIEEIKMYQDQPIQYAEMLFEELVYQGNTLGQDIAGTEDSIRKMTRSDLVNYFQSFYAPQNAVITVAGKTDKNLQKTLSRYFGQPINKKEFASRKFQVFDNKQKEPRILLHYKDTKQAHLALGFPAYPYKHPDIYALQVLAVILGGNMSSRLFIQVRERKGLCYYIRSQADCYQDTGNLLIRSGLDITKVPQALKIITAELKNIKNKGVSQKELAMAKEFIKGRTVLQLEESNYLADYYARQALLTDEVLEPEEKIKKLFAVGAKQVQKVANDLIKTEKVNLAIVGPFKDKGEFAELIKV